MVPPRNVTLIVIDDSNQGKVLFVQINNIQPNPKILKGCDCVNMINDSNLYHKCGSDYSKFCDLMRIFLVLRFIAVDKNSDSDKNLLVVLILGENI